VKKRAGAAGALVVLALLALAAGGSRAPEPSPEPSPKPPRPTPEPEEPDGPVPYTIGPGPDGGWFWWFVDWTKDGAAFAEFLTREAGNVEVRKILSYQGNRYAVIVFEVLVDPVVWTLPGKPTPAPKKAATELTDIEQAPPPEVPGVFWQWLEEMTRHDREAIERWDRQLQEWLNEKLRGGASE
jgi:hypothetical protein